MILYRMKFLFSYFIAVIFSFNCFSQSRDSVISFQYRTVSEKWTLEINSQDTFTFVVYNPNENFGLGINGKYTIIDSSMHFICDTPNKGIDRVRDNMSYGSNSQIIAKNESFKFISNYLIPKPNKEFQRNVSPNSIYGKYYTGDDLGSNSIELKKNHTYIIEDNSCTLRMKETGRWVLKDNFITFLPHEKKKTSLIELTLKEKKVFVTDLFLIGKLRNDQYPTPLDYVIKEAFIYFIKISD